MNSEETYCQQDTCELLIGLGKNLDKYKKGTIYVYPLSWAAKWLREEKNLHIMPDVVSNFKYYFNIRNTKTGLYLFDSTTDYPEENIGIFYTYEGALEDGIKCCCIYYDSFIKQLEEYESFYS